MIETPTRTVYDWYGLAKLAPGVGAFLRSDSGKVWRVTDVRRVKVRVTRGETCRLALQLIRWREDPGAGERVYSIEWVKRGRR